MSLDVNVVARLSGRVVSCYKSDASPATPRIHEFTLGAAAEREIAFDTLDGTSLSFLLISAVLSSDGETPATVKYAMDDAADADPANYGSWKVVDGVGGTLWTTTALSATNKMYVYNAGTASIRVTVVTDL